MPNVTWTRDLAAHLLRRAGFGSSKAELDLYFGLGLKGAVDRLVDYESVSNADLDARIAAIPFNFDRVRDAQSWWILRMLGTARPLEEKMVFFWHDHFATSAEKVRSLPMKNQIDLFRSLALADFDDLVVAVSKDPAMLDWLDNRTNRVGRPNENYARELMELFTLGIGNYTEEDIHEIARCFTGWTIRNDAYFFAAGAHDTGSKTFLGTTIPAGGGESDGVTVCETVVRHPACAPFLTRKLWEFFVYPNPSNAIVAKFARVFADNGYSVRELMRAILMSDDFYSEQALFALVKSPAEYVVGALKALDADVDVTRGFNGAAPNTQMTLMGQTLLAPPDVAGWDGGLAWINTTTLLSRANFGNLIATDRADDDRGYYVSVDGLLAGVNVPNANKLVDVLVDRMGPLTLTKKQKKPLKNYVLFDDSGKKGEFVLDTTTRDKKVRGLIHLITTLPEYHQN
jgi:uncharacterized protein (DUF1800 family)